MKTRRIIMTVIALLLVAAGTVNAQPLVDGWRKIQTGAEGNLYDICCIDADHIWVCAQDGGLLKSSDGGETWVRKHTEEGFAMSRIKFANENVGYAMGVRDKRNMVLLKTIDAGETWTRVADTALDAVAVGRAESREGDWQLVGTDTLYFFESLSNRRANLYRSTDGGHSFEDFLWVLPFENLSEQREAAALGLHFEDNEGFCVYSTIGSGTYGDVPALRAFKTSDYGQTWTRHTLFIGDDDPWGDSPYNTVGVFNTARIHVLNLSEAKLFYQWGYFDTHDGFASAELMYEDEAYYFYPGVWYYSSDFPTRLNFSDDIHGCAIGVGPTLIKSKDDPYTPNGYAVITDDGGETWRIFGYGMDPDHLLYAVDGVDTTFYVTSDRGIVYKRSLVNGPQAVMEGASPEGIAVSPTLTDGVVTVSGESLVELQVYNTLGQRILTLQPSESIATIDLTGQPAGMYFISVTDQNGVRCVKKIVKQ